MPPPHDAVKLKTQRKPPKLNQDMILSLKNEWSPKISPGPKDLKRVSVAIHDKTHVMELRLLRWETVLGCQRHMKCNTYPWKREAERESAYQQEKIVWPWRTMSGDKQAQKKNCKKQISFYPRASGEVQISWNVGSVSQLSLQIFISNTVKA